MPRVQLLSHMVSVQLFKKLPNSFPEWWYHFTFPPAISDRSISSTFSPPGVVTRNYFSFSNWCVGILLCGLNLHFSEARYVKCVLIFHLYIHFNEVSVHIFCTFSSWIVFLQLRFECSLYILDMSPHLGVEVQDPQVSQ